MFNKNAQTITPTESGRIPYCDQIIIATLLVIIIAVPLYFDIHLHSVFDLSKITILYVLTFAMLAIWSIKTIINAKQTLPEPMVNSQDRHVQPPNPPTISVQINENRDYAPQLLRQPLILPILALLFISGFATAFSTNPYLSLVGTYKRYGGFISTIVYISLFFVIIHFIDKKRLSSLLNIIILTACFASIYGILQHFGLDLYKWSVSTGPGMRVSATFGHRAFFSAFLIMVIPLVLIKIFSNSGFRYSTFLYLGILTLFMVAFYYTKARASFLGFIISNLFFICLIGKKNLLSNKTKTIATITIIIGSSIFFNVNDRTSVIGRFVEEIKPVHRDSTSGEKTNNRQDKNLTKQDLFTQPTLVDDTSKDEPDSSQYHRLSDGHGSDWNVSLARQIEGTTLTRFLQYLASFRIIRDYPVLGIGPDTLGMIYPQYIAKLYRDMNEHRVFENQNRIHNDLLNRTVSTGLLGLGVYAWLIFAYARMVWKGCKKAKGPDKILIIGLCSGCLAYFIQNQFSFGHVPIITLFWFLIAMSVIASPVTCSLPDGRPARAGTCQTASFRRVGNPAIRRFGKQTFCGIIICLMVLLITLSLFRYKADLYFEHGRRSLNKNEITEAIQSYETAVKYNPLALNYRNVLNGIYLKMAEIGANKDSNKITEGLENIFSREQTIMWFANAIDGAEQVQKLYPRDYHSAYTLGQAYNLLDKKLPARPTKRSGNEEMSKEAIKYYKRATMLHPFKFELRNKLARLYAEKGQYEDAIHELKEAKRILPSNQAAYLNLAKVLMNDDERYEEAEAVLLEFIKKNPDSKIIDIYRLLSFIYLKTAKWEEVREQSIKIIQIDREDLEAHKYAIMANLKLERYDHAQKLCNRILNLTGDANNTYNKYAKEMLELLSEK